MPGSLVGVDDPGWSGRDRAGAQAVSDVHSFGVIVLVVALGFSAALATIRLTSRIRVPAPAIYLLAAAVASDLAPGLGDALSTETVVRVGTVALIVILFDGGMGVGWRRLRASAGPVAGLGIVGTFATALVIALAAHTLLGTSWTTAAMLAAALAPTDPAVLFSILANREVGGRTGTILKGEAGANDPVGIALMLGVLQYAANDASGGSIAGEFCIELVVGLVVGLAGGRALVALMQRVSLPGESLYPLRTLAAAGVIYGAATVAHGSGFLAVFVAGMLVGDARAPFKPAIEHFHSSLAGIAEIAVFVVLGLTIDLGMAADELVDGLILSLVLVLVARPLVVGLLLWPAHLRRGEKLFVAATGFKGAVPILLGAIAVSEQAPDATRVYDLIFVVVAITVLVQGPSIEPVARLLRIRLRASEPQPWTLSIGTAGEARGTARFKVRAGAPACGRAIRELPLGDRAWISLLVRDGKAFAPRGERVLEEGDDLLVIAAERDHRPLARLIEGRPEEAACGGRNHPPRVRAPAGRASSVRRRLTHAL